MPLIDAYLAQSATFAPHAGDTTDGEPTFGAPQTVAVRFVDGEVEATDEHGPVRAGDARLWLGAAPTVRVQDRFTVESVAYRVASVERRRDAAGAVTHQACVLRRDT